MNISTSSSIFSIGFMATFFIIVFFRIFREKASFKFCVGLLLFCSLFPLLTGVFSVDEDIWPRSFYSSFCFGLSSILIACSFVCFLPRISDYRDKRIIIGLLIAASFLNALGEALRFYFPDSDVAGIAKMIAATSNLVNFFILMTIAAFITFLNFLLSNFTWIEE